MFVLVVLRISDCALLYAWRLTWIMTARLLISAHTNKLALFYFTQNGNALATLEYGIYMGSSPSFDNLIRIKWIINHIWVRFERVLWMRWRGQCAQNSQISVWYLATSKEGCWGADSSRGRITVCSGEIWTTPTLCVYLPYWRSFVICSCNH